MNSIVLYGVVLVLILAVELLYFKIADHFNIIDKPNERSSHSTIVLRGGGILFPIAALVWTLLAGAGVTGEEIQISTYLPFIIGMVLVAGISFVDDIISLPDSLRLVVQFISYGLMFWSLGVFGLFSEYGWLVGIGSALLALVVCVGATNIYNFMDGINGITAGYSLAVLVPLMLMNQQYAFVPMSLLVVTTLAVLVFSIFNFRPKGKAKCFAGDVGSIGIAFVLLFCIGRLILQPAKASDTAPDITWIIFLLVYGVDGVLTICHRIMLHENLGEAHRKHIFQLMANELKMGHVTVTLIYMALQLELSLGFVYLCPDRVGAHWLYLLGAIVVLAIVYVAFKKKYYHLHEAYLASLKK